MTRRTLILTIDADAALAEVSAHDGRTMVRLDTVRRPDGFLEVDVDDEVYRAVNAARVPGESDSDVILRLAHAYLGRALQ